jgi:predicted porin
MKKSLLALAVLSAFAGVASAQSTVTLSGGVDLAVARTGGQWSMGTSGSSRSNFTLAGSEDLGGGMSAFFTLNHRFKPNDGTLNPGGNAGPTGSTQFYRNTFVGLKGGFGDVRLGRILMPLQDFNGGFEPWGGGDTVGHTHTGGIKATVRANNTIYYRSPSMGGLQVHAAIAAAEGQTPAASLERPMGFGVRYDAGPLSAAVAYDRNDQDLATTGFYAKYNFGMATLLVQYEKGDISATVDVDRYSISAIVPMGAGAFKVGYMSWSDENTKKFGVGYDYNLSKRTQLYTNVGKLSGSAPSATAKKAMFDVGIWHKF